MDKTRTVSQWALATTRFRTFQFEPEILREIAKLRPDNVTGALYIAKDYLVIVAAALLTVWVSWWFYPLSLLLIGAHQRGLTTIAHDAAHKTLAKSKVLNFALGIVFAAYPLFQRHWAYRISHVHLHHPHLGNPDKDPDVAFFVRSRVYDAQPPSKYIRRLVIYPILGLATVSYLRFLFSNRFSINPNDKGDLGKIGLLCDTVGFFSFWAVVAIASLLTGSWPYLFLFWIVPYLTIFQILGWFVELAEHTPLCETETENIYLTRNRKGNLLERVFLGVNLDEYHLEHHLSPGVPFWLLKDAQRIRLRNADYARLAKTWGGVFVRGPYGGPSVIRQLIDRNQSLHYQDTLATSRNGQPLPNGA